jgi:hypothetical protein
MALLVAVVVVVFHQLFAVVPVPLAALLAMVVQVVRAAMVVQVAWLSLPLLRYPLTT